MAVQSKAMRKADWLYKPSFQFTIFTVIVLVISLQAVLQAPSPFNGSAIAYTAYNNYIIFKQSFYHLIHNKDLYILYPDEHWDLYKYSPAFALLMGPLAILPDFAGLFLWNMLNAIILLVAIQQLPLLDKQKKLLSLGFVLLELITSLQNEQSNALIAGLIILAFVQMEKKRVALASLFIVLTVAIKLFGIVAFALFLFYPQKIKSIAFTLLWLLVFTFIPLTVVSWDQLVFLYKSWGHLLQNDHDISYGLSVAGWLYTWFGWSLKSETVIAGVLLFCLPLLRIRQYKNFTYRLLYVASVLLWVVIFNHKAESPTFVIATAGVALWYYYQQPNKINTALLLLTFVFTVLSPTDLFPRIIRTNYVIPYVLKAVPCIWVWLKLTYDLLTIKDTPAVAES